MRVVVAIASILTLAAWPGARASAQIEPPAPAVPPAVPAEPNAPAPDSDAPAGEAPAPETPASEAPASEAPAAPKAAGPPPAAPAAAQSAPSQPPAPPAQPPAQPPVAYPPLGGTPEQQDEQGDWDPWDHPEAFGRNDHSGFFLRLALGVGYGHASSRTDGAGGDGPGFSGGGLGFDIAIGGSVLTNLAIHAEFFGMAMPSPKVRNGNRALVGADVQLGAFGVGLTYHIMPVNLFVSGAAGLGTVAFEREDATPDSTRLGVATHLMVGKEWWVDSQWGVGLAGQLMWVSAADRTYDHVNGLAVNLLFSATYN